MILLGGLAFQGHGGLVHGRLAGLQVTRFHGGEALHQLLHKGVFKAARQRDHHPVRGVVALLVLLEPLAGHLLQGGLFAQDGTCQRTALIDGGAHPLHHQVSRVIGIHADFLQDDAPLRLHIFFRKFGVEEHTAQNVCRLPQVGVQGTAVEAGTLLGGEGVHLPADGVHPLGHLPCGVGAGALEEHMLDEVGGAVLAGLFLPGAGAHPDAQGGTADGGNVFGVKAHPVGQGGGMTI